MEVQVHEQSLAQIETATPVSVTCVRLVGDIDGSSAAVVQAQISPLTKPDSNLILDLSQVAYMSSAGLRMLLLIYRQMTNQNGKVVLVGLSEEIQDTMSITGFLDFFQATDTLIGAYGILGVTP